MVLERNKANLDNKRKIKMRNTKAIHDADFVIKVMYVLEQKNMNITQTAKELKLSKATVFRYKQDYWEDYLKKKETDAEDFARRFSIKAVVEKAKEPITPANAEEVVQVLMSVREKLEYSFFLAMDEIDRRIQSPVERRRLFTKDLIQHATNILPYLILKKMEEKTDETKEKETSFMDNFITMMNEYKSKQQEKNENNKDKN